MGTTVLDSGVPVRAALHIYAHCLRGTAGGVALLAINTDKVASQTLSLRAAGQRYTLSGSLEGKRVQLNGHELELDARDGLPPLAGVRTRPGDITLAPATITFLGLPEAANRSCR